MNECVHGSTVWRGPFLFCEKCGDQLPMAFATQSKEIERLTAEKSEAIQAFAAEVRKNMGFETLLELLHSAVFESTDERGGKTFRDVLTEYQRLRAALDETKEQEHSDE